MISRLLPVLLAWQVAGSAVAATNTLSDAETQGRALAQQLLAQGPLSNLVQTATLNIRLGPGKRREIPLRIETRVSAPEWQMIYETSAPSNRVRLVVTHQPGRPNRYDFWPELPEAGSAEDRPAAILTGSQLMQPFAGSDFWVGDLGQEFFHWPQQKLVKKVIYNSRACSILESTSPDPADEGYARVVTWIDSESLGPQHAEAYDARGRKLKEFQTKELKKVNGQWQVSVLEIENDQTGTRTLLEFNLRASAASTGNAAPTGF